MGYRCEWETSMGDYNFKTNNFTHAQVLFIESANRPTREFFEFRSVTNGSFVLCTEDDLNSCGGVGTALYKRWRNLMRNSPF